MSKQQYLVERVQELARLIRSNSADINAKDTREEYVTPQELDKLIRMLRPTGNTNEHANAVRLRLRQNILNHPSAGSEGPLMLSKFDKSCENVRKLSPHILNPFLIFLKPVSFYEGALLKQNVGQSKKAFPNVFQVDEQLHQDQKSVADPNSKPATFVQPLPTQVALTPATAGNTNPNSPNSVAVSSHWIEPELERRLLIDIVYILQGVTGKYIKYDTRSESYIIDPTLLLSTTIRDMILCICELGWLFNRINEYLKRVFQQDGATTTNVNTALSSFASSNLIPPKGLIIQAFGYALQEQLHDYYRLLAILEQELLKSSTKMPSTDFYMQNQTVAVQHQYSPTIPSNYRDKAYESKAPDQEPPSLNYGLTILRLKAWMQEPIERMCLLARLIDSVQHLSGGALISRLYAHSKHGDQLSLSLVQRILDSVCNPLYSMLNRWILHGELNDPYGEFFISKNSQFNLTNPTYNLWQDLYILRSNLLPSFITQAMAEKLLIIGKSIDFMKLCLQRVPVGSNKNSKLHTASGARKSYRQINKMKKLTTYGRVVDQDDGVGGGTEHQTGDEASSTALIATNQTWTHEESKNKVSVIGNPQDILQSIYAVLQKYYLQLQQSGSSPQQVFDNSSAQYPSIEDILQMFLTHYHTHSTHASCTPTQLTFATCISELSTVIDTQLVNLLTSTFQLKSHLLALKKFLLLGQGDFIIGFMDAIGPELKKRANQLFRHNLLSILEGSLRASNAQYESNDIIERISVRLLESKPGDTGWEIFSLDYIVDLPLNVIVHQQAMNQYRIAFHMLWRLKRVEWSLSITWKQFLSFSHTFHDYFHYAVSQRSNPLKNTNAGSMFANILSQTSNKSHHQSTTVYQFSIELRSIFHYCNLNRAHMMHVVNNLCAFLMFEVMETTWLQLEEKLESAKSLNDIIIAHDQYLQAILDRSLLSPVHESLNLQLQTLLQIILRFCQLEETLVADAMACITRHRMFGRDPSGKGKDGDDDTVSSNITSSTRGGKQIGGFNPSVPIDGIPAIMISRITETVREYHTQFETFMNMLKQEGEKFGEILRFLAFRLDFNSYHENQKSSSNAITVIGNFPAEKPASTSMAGNNSVPTRAPSNNLASSSSSTKFSSTTAERDALLAKYASKVGVSAASITSSTNASNRMYRSTIQSEKGTTATGASTAKHSSGMGPYK